MDPVDRSRSSRTVRRVTRRAVPLVMASSLVLVAVGCGTPAKVEVSAPSATGAGGLSDGITVTGTGKVKGKPDPLAVSIGVTTKRPTVDAAVADNAGTATALSDALTAKSVHPDDIQTSNYSVQ